MARYARNLLVLFGPPALVAWPLLRQYVAGTAGSDRDVHVVSVTAHLAAAMLILAALAMSVRLRWAADRALLAAQTVFWMDVAAAWGLTCAAATTMIVNWLSAFDAFWGLSIVMIFANVLSAALLAFMIRRAEQGKARPRPWTMFA